MIFERFDHVNLAATLNSQGRYLEAIEACRLGLDQGRDLPELFAQLGRAALGFEQTADAIAACEAALALDPTCLRAQLELAIARRLSGDRSGALAGAREGLALEPDSEHAHCVLATLLLWDGEMVDGLREQEWHWRRETELLAERYGAERRWDGAAAPALRLLVAHEQGYGDLFHAARYFGRLRERVGRVIVECAPDVADLIRPLPGVDAVVFKGESVSADFDAYVRLMSVPALFGADPLRAEIPYLRADPARVRAWEERRGEHAALRVGFAWAGSPAHTNDRERSVPRERFEALDLEGVHWFPLEKSPEFETFADTAALIETLDLVVCVDTAVAHLAGAMNKPVWLLLSARPDWRWGLESGTTPWYPSMRLFRRTLGGRWDHVFEEVRAELVALVAA